MEAGVVGAERASESAGAIERCPGCGGALWSFWTRLPLEALPELIPIYTSLELWRKTDRIEVEVTCARPTCLRTAYAWRRPSPSLSTPEPA